MMWRRETKPIREFLPKNEDDLNQLFKNRLKQAGEPPDSYRSVLAPIGSLLLGQRETETGKRMEEGPIFESSRYAGPAQPERITGLLGEARR
jgi:hypothetical protein